MSLLSQAELDDLHATYATALSDQCQLKPSVDTDDGQGGYTQGWPSVRETVACAVSDAPTGGSDSGLIDVPSGQRIKQIALPRGTALIASDRIAWVEGAKTFEAVTVTPAGTYGPATLVVAVEVLS